MTDDVTPLLPAWLRHTFYGMGAIFALILIGFSTVWLFIKLPFGEALVIDAIVGTLNAEGDMVVAVGDIEGDLPSALTLMGITVEDASGQWLTIDQVSLSWRPWSLLTGRVLVDDISAGTVTVLRLPESATPSGEGDPIDFDGLRDLLARLRVESAAVEHMVTFYPSADAPLSASLSGHLEPDESGRPRLELGLQEKTQGGTASVSATLAERQRITIAVEATLAGSNLKGTGSFNTRTDVVSAKAKGVLVPETLPDMGGLTFDNAAFDIAVSGTLNALTAQVGYTVTQPSVDDTTLDRFDGVADLAWNGRRLTVDAAGGVANIMPMVPALAPLLRPEVLYSVAAQIDPTGGDNGVAVASDIVATLESGDLAAAFSGTVDLGSLNGRGTVSVTGTGLAQLAGWADDASQTKLEFDVSEISATGIEAQLSGSSDGLTAPSGELTQFVAGPVRYSAVLSADMDAAQITGISIAAPNFSVGGTADLRFDGQTIAIDLTESTVTLDALSDQLSGQVSAVGTVSGLLSSPNAVLRLSGAEILFGQESFRDVDLSTVVNFAQTPLILSVDGSVSVAEGPLALDVDATFTDEESVMLSPLSVVGAGVSLGGALDLDLVQGLVDGSLDVSFETLAIPAAVSGIPLSGTAELSLALAPVADAQSVSWAVQAETLRYGGAAAALGTLEVTGQWRGGDAPTLDFALEGGNGFVGDQAIGFLSAEATGPLSGLSVTAAARAPDDGVRTSLTGEIALAEQATTVSLTAFELADASGSLALAAPAQVIVSPSRITAENFNFTVGSGQLQARLAVDQLAETIIASLTGKDLPFSTLQFFDSDLEVFGTYDVTVDLSGALASPQGKVLIATTDVALPDTGLENGVVEINLALTDKRLTLDSSVSGFFETPASLTGSLPFVLNLADGQVRVPLDQPADLAMVWSGAIEPVWSVLPLISHRMAGRADVDLKLTGSLDTPQLAGYARLADGSYENLDLGTLLRDVQLGLNAEDLSTLTFAAEANDGDDGRVSGNGRLTRNGDNDFSGDLSFTMDNTRLVRRDDVKVRGSGTLTYALTPDRDRLEGDIQVDSAQVSLTASYVEPIQTLDVVDPNAPAQAVRSARSGKDVDLAVTITAPRRIGVVGRGLDSEWSADMRLGGTLSAPELEGSLDVLRGEFSFLSELFDLTRGQILFTGGGQIDPDLSVVAERASGGVTARVEVGGRASAPSITLTSDPSLPQDEILSRIIFNKSAGQLGPLEAVQLANAAAELAGLAGRGGVVGSLRRSVGLDVFRFGSDTGGSTIVVGERLSKNIFVGVEQGLEGQGSQLIIEWQLTNNLALKSTTRQDTGADIGLRWSRDY